ncbi:hypothetical protein [Lewinella sp. 4G2]|uniref:hypothetical protein n=1 Tax=Lewinella sp. 4G2 TaxID=1803372 RepID=UPI0007B49418|nr:hypothetical protein [Lewinella sp. 4G2]OAV43036.1 hypothetical protein A3850_000315 [Lewinella sp. 4G2]
MTSQTYFKPYHLYTLSTPLGPIGRVLVIAGDDACRDKYQKSITILPVYDNSRDEGAYISVPIRARVHAEAPPSQESVFIAIAGAFPMPRRNVEINSATPITFNEERAIKRKLREYLAL